MQEEDKDQTKSNEEEKVDYWLKMEISQLQNTHSFKAAYMKELIFSSKVQY